MTFLARATYSQHLSSTAMAMSSSFCPHLPSQFGTKPIFYFPAKPSFSLSFKAFSAQASNASSGKEELRVGFLGLGIMGAPMAQNLIKSGCDVTVWNRTKSKCDPLINLGAKYQSSPQEVAASCDVTFAMLADPNSALDVACGENGAASGMAPGAMPSALLLLLLLLAVSAANAAVFREAPQFYNSPDCPSIADDLEDPDENEHHLCFDRAVHVAMTLDTAYIRGSMAAVLSVLQHSSCPQNVIFHFVHSASANESSLRATVSHSFPYLKFQLYPFNDEAASRLISTSIRSALDCPLNYARSYLANLLPTCVGRVVYLDSDLILVDDIAKLAAHSLGDDSVLAAPEYCNANFTAYFTPSFWSNPSLSLTFANRKACYFNTGVMVIDLDRWRAGDYTTKIEEWMELQKRMRIYELGSLPPFLLVFGGRMAPVDHRWNQHGLGGDNIRGLCRDLHPGPVSLLHWSGKGKPWARLDANRPCPLDALWVPYDLLQTPFSIDS